ncbi:MAG: FAD-dependent thymidylate synthase [bacterium]|nr:FAD-dependent thymidylate synthase [bacterium]
MFTEGVLNSARQFISTPMGWNYTSNETRAIDPFFTNRDRRVFFMHTLPASVGTTLLAMFSRIKNPRGVRGVFVDAFLPQFLATQLTDVEKSFGGDEAKFIRDRKIGTLDSFVNYSEEARNLFEDFLKRGALDPEYLKVLAQSNKAQKFLSVWLSEKYGHNSIARVGSVWLCCEKISILAIKTMEWSRPGAGYIELSTRYVDMSSAGCYPIENELKEGWKVDPEIVISARNDAFATYDALAGANFDGPFPNFLREKFGSAFSAVPKDLEMGVIGETCDVLGNLLPSSSLSSVGMCLSGEAFGEVLSHLLLDVTPENIVLVETILKETDQIGVREFAKYFVPTDWKKTHWQYLDTQKFLDLAQEEHTQAKPLVGYNRFAVETSIMAALQLRDGVKASGDFATVFANAGMGTVRSPFDKLPAEFESFTMAMRGMMTYRGWRDLQRMGFCTHLRTYVTTDLGYYKYDKVDYSPLKKAFLASAKDGVWLEHEMKRKGVPAILRQYPLALGWNIGFSVAANLRQWEFCDWQRSKYSVNHEVRQAFLSAENYLRELLPWWKDVSRADITPAYIFARGSTAIALENK